MQESDKLNIDKASRIYKRLVAANCRRRGVTTPEEVTPFQRRVLVALCRVPSGRVTTYGKLAAAIGCGSPRAVGGALSRNPFAPEVPCHRVIAGDGTIGGFHGGHKREYVCRKESLLREEGVEFGRGRLLDQARVWP